MSLDEFRFSTDVRVRFAETDAQGVAHNAEFLVWYEVGRIDHLARFRYDYAIERLSDNVIVADGWTKHAVVDRTTHRPTRFPAWLAEAIASAEC